MSNEKADAPYNVYIKVHVYISLLNFLAKLITVVSTLFTYSLVDYFVSEIK